MSCAENSPRARFSGKDLLLYAVTDRAWLREKTLEQLVEEAILGGVTCVQLREKSLDDPSFLEEAVRMKEICARHNVPLIVNDNVEVARACGADGVHVGQEDMAAARAREMLGENVIIGVSVHTPEQALQAEQDGADYLGLGAVFPTSTKTDVGVMPNETIRAICESVHIPVVAIGGINEKTLPLLAGSKIDGVAVVSALFAAPDIREAARVLRRMAEKEF